MLVGNMRVSKADGPLTPVKCRRARLPGYAHTPAD
jgi:hypothetical protein